MTPMFDIPQLETRLGSEAGTNYVVKALDGITPVLNADGLPLTLKVLGRDSRAYQTAVFEMGQARIARIGQGGNAGTTMEEAEANTIAILVKCTVGWTNFLDREGIPVPFGATAAADLYRFFPAIRDQVDAFIGNRANFLQPPAKP